MSNIADMRRKFKDELTPRDIIVLILSNCKDIKLFNEQEKIHEAFYQVKQLGAFRPYFKDYHFTAWGKPYSEELDNSLMAIADSSILRALNPAYEEFSFKCSDKVIKDIERKVEHHGELRDALSEAQEILKNALKVQ